MKEIIISLSIVLGIIAIILSSLINSIFKRLSVLELPEYKEDEFEIEHHRCIFSIYYTFESSKDLGNQIRIGKLRYTRQEIKELNQEVFIYESDDIF